MELSKDELNKVWLVTGSCGMDSSHIFDILLEKGYTNIHGTMRRSATFNSQNIDHIFDKLQLHYADLTDPMNIHNIIAKIKPSYIIHMASQSHVGVSAELENYTFQTNTLGTLSILQSVRSLGLSDTCKIYFANTSECFGNTTDGTKMLDENTPFAPVSLYAISKVAASNICNMYRDAYKMFIVSSVLFNHEGPRRGATFVTQKISNYVGKYHKNNSIRPLELGNLNSRRDWGSAKIYMLGVYLMLQQKKPQNYVLATGETHSVREFVELAFKEIGVDIVWQGTGVNEIGIERWSKHIIVKINPKYYRDIDIECLIGDASKAKKELGWTYDLSFNDLVKEMVTESIKRA